MTPRALLDERGTGEGREAERNADAISGFRARGVSRSVEAPPCGQDVGAPMSPIERVVLLGFSLDGPVHAAAPKLGEVHFGPASFLRDLELRLGLPTVDERPALRLPRWTSRLREVMQPEDFYAKSFLADELGTAELLLKWRDDLVEAGWDEKAPPAGGARLQALARLANHEAFPLYPLPPGRADRLRSVAKALESRAVRLYDKVRLLEARDAWSALWNRIFAGLEGAGTAIVHERHADESAPSSSDLGKLQSLLLENLGGAPETEEPIQGDGSLLMVRGETPTEVAEISAALLASDSEAALVVRAGTDPAPLEGALRRFGLAGQGITGSSPWRPALQVLPLALELAFEPKDPYRALELLTLPVGPFRGRLGATLGKAIARQPGVLGQEWKRRKTEAGESLRRRYLQRAADDGRNEPDLEAAADAHVAERLARVEEWLEAPGVEGEISREALGQIVARTQRWLQGQLAIEELRPVYAAAFGQGARFADALHNHDVASFSREAVRQLFDSVARRDERASLRKEESGRISHVDHPSSVLEKASTTLVWSFVSGTEARPKTRPWTRDETAALADAGVHFVDPRAALRIEAEAWRRTVLSTSKRLVLVVPGSQDGAAAAPHPLWDEILTRLALDSHPQAAARIVRDVRSVVRGSSPPERARLAPIAALEPLPLPAAAEAWNLPPALVDVRGANATGASATALQALVGCPLSWVLEHRAKLKFGSVTKIAEGPLLNGNLSHRLVEELFREGAFDQTEGAFKDRVGQVLNALVRTEAATLLLPGAVFERAQLMKQVENAMRELYRYLARAGFRITSVEEPVALNATVGSPHGRLDLLLEDANGNLAILDLKWGRSTYEAYLQRGTAIQLALYSQAIGARSTPPTWPPAGYFALSSATVLASDPRMKAVPTMEGISLSETWDRFERTRRAVIAKVEAGEVLVAQPHAAPLLERLGVPEAEHERHYAAEPGDAGACKFCSFGPICGKAWEGAR